MAGIMCLPLEIRILIYEHCLIVNHTVGSRRKNLNTDSSEERKHINPTVTLLAVSKAIGSEAAEVLYGKNKWLLSSTAQNPIYRLLSERNKPGSLWSSRAPLFRHVTLDFPLTFEILGVLLGVERHLPLDNVSRGWLYYLERRMAELHVTSECRIKVNIMKQMTNLSSITIDYGQSQVPESDEADFKFMKKMLVRFCRSWRSANGDGKPRWPPLNITIANIDSMTRGMLRRFDPEREWLDESFYEEAIGVYWESPTLLCTMNSPYIPRGQR